MMDIKDFKRLQANGIIFDPEEVEAIISAFGELKINQLYTKRMRKFNCLDCIMKSVGFDKALGSSMMRSMSFSRAADLINKNAIEYDDSSPEELVPVLGDNVKDGLDALSYLYYDYIPSLSED